MNIDEANDLVARYFELNTAKDPQGIAAMYRADATVADPVDSPPHIGREAITAFYAASHQMADSMAFELTGPVCVAGPFLAFPFRVTSKIGDMSVALDVIDTMEVDDDGLVRSMSAYWNMASARTV